MIKVKRIGILSFAVFQAVLMSFIGLIAGILYSFGGAIHDLVTTGSVNWGTALAFFALIGMPVIFAAAGFVLGLFEAILFNFSTRWFGGITIDIN